jgi:hypothetical protein
LAVVGLWGKRKEMAGLNTSGRPGRPTASPGEGEVLKEDSYPISILFLGKQEALTDD